MWVSWFSWQGLKQLWQKRTTHLSTVTLTSFLLFVLLEFFLLIYGLNKDISVVPRYSFVYFPALCALLGASFVHRKISNPKPTSVIFLLVIGLLSSLVVIFNLAFQKPFTPNIVARNFTQSPEPLAIVIPYGNSLDLALGLSYALAVGQLRQQHEETDLVFLDNRQGYETVWQKISELPLCARNLWIVGPGLFDDSFPSRLSLAAQQTSCNIDIGEFYRVGSYPYQLYRCRLELE
ncbi:MAG: hypothetical protein F6K24_51995 [Okeania sp. SIO2D1]|nr:hypothetical protein [Okeania sp. SIO2D1]